MMATDTRTEKEKMLAGELYNAFTPQLLSERAACRELIYDFNSTRPNEAEKRDEIIRKLFGQFGSNSVIETPFKCDYVERKLLRNSFYSPSIVLLIDG
ncbi:unnamed protein product [Rotaria socialis]